MLRAWLVLPDGRYKTLSPGEDLATDFETVKTDVATAIEDLLAIQAEARAICVESGRLAEQSRRQRRLRASKMRLVRSSSPES